MCALAGRYIEKCHASVEYRHSNLQVVEQVKSNTDKISATDWVMANMHVEVRAIDGKFDGRRARGSQCASCCGLRRLSDGG